MTDLSRLLLAWFSENGRRLPWRGHPDPYAIWVSEVMLQQTRVEAVIPYFKKWMTLFPFLPDLAAATEREVLSAWEGLGYYTRARNLHKAAQQVVERYAGELPPDPDRLGSLPGIGRYTAGAIASIAFGLDVVSLDGNQKRVFARLFDVNEPVDSAAGEARLKELAEQNLPPGQAGLYNQALMDLGAVVCLPKKPRCPLCPLAEGCLTRRAGTQESRPVRKPKKVIPHYLVTAAVVERDGLYLLARRPADGLLGGMWEFPGGKQEPGEELPTALQREIREELAVQVRVGERLGIYRHAYTHFRITLHAFACRLIAGEPQPLEAAELAWVLPADLSDYPMGKVDRMIAAELQEREGLGRGALTG